MLVAKTFPTMAVTRCERPMRCGAGGKGGDKSEQSRPDRDNRRTALGGTLRALRIVDHHLSDVNISRLKLTSHALHQPGKIHNEETFA
jgi:hypothetical protein